MKNMEEKLAKLKREEIISVLNSIYSIASEKEIDFENMPTNIRSILKPYIKANVEKRVNLIYDFNEGLEAIEVDDDIKALASDIRKYIGNIYYRSPLKKFNEDNLEDRLYDLDEENEKNNEKLEVKLIELLREQDDSLNAVSIPSIVEGLIKTYEGLDPIKKIKFLEILDDHYENEHHKEIEIILAQIKKQEIMGILAKVNNLSAHSQRKFFESAYDEIVSLYGSIAKKERIKNCKHEFDKWKDCSYTDYITTRIDLQMCDNVPVKRIVYTRKCKKCGFKETMNEVPDEVRIENARKAKEKEIKSLERRLKKLKEEN